MSQPFDVIAYTADACVYCPICVNDMYEGKSIDYEGNEIGPVFRDSEFDYPTVCESCGNYLDLRLTTDGVTYSLGLLRDAVYDYTVTDFLISVANTLDRYLQDNYILDQFDIMTKDVLGIDK